MPIRTRLQIVTQICNVAGALALLTPLSFAATPRPPAPAVISTGWQLQEAAKVSEPGADVASLKFKSSGWYAATVPGTVLTTLVNNHVYPEPLYGENNRPDKIPESLARSSYWYRAVVRVPVAYLGRQVWLNFEGINYSAEVWVNGSRVGTMRGAFSRGIFNISSLVKPGKSVALAVLITPQPNPGDPHEHTIRDGVGKNGGISSIDGPTFLSTIGWDWIPAIRDRDAGIWQKVFLSASGPVVVKDPLITTELALPKLDSADVSVRTTLENISDRPQRGVLKGAFGSVSFQKEVEIAPHSVQSISLDPTNTPALHLSNPKLWWPNGYGPQNLYRLHLKFEIGDKASDSQTISFGVRKIAYSVPDSENLTVSVNGVKIFIRGGNWGLDEAMKRIPRERLEAQVRMHKLANLNLIRNWVGQSTSEDFYELCDKYGLLLWDEFFQPNPTDGPDPTDLATYLTNVREKILRFRNHPSIAIWCARNEGYPPKEIDNALRALMAELEPTRLYQPSSTDGKGVVSHGPYHWRTPREFYVYENEPFKTEIGSLSVPTMESIQGMMPEKDWEVINDDWAEHDFAKGASNGDTYPAMIASRYGKIVNLADFVRKSQLANYEAYRAMYEGRNATLFSPSTALITWMSNPAQPSFVWQLYHHDLEPNSSLFAVKSAGEPVHIQLNELNGSLQVINNMTDPISNAVANVAIYNLDGSLQYEHDFAVSARAGSATSLGDTAWPTTLSQVHFIKLQLHDSTGKLLSDNFYWRALPESPDDLKALDTLPKVTLETEVTRNEAHGATVLTIKIHNPTSQIALMTHLQLRRKSTGERVLPAYYSDNYLSLVPDETRIITIETATSELKGELPLVVVDGWNIDVVPSSTRSAAIALNVNAQVSHWPETGLPMISDSK